MTFAVEQRALAAACWQFVGLADDLATDDAWIRRTLFGTDIFIQRFGDELRGFHNLCSHRGFPLRRERAGVGHIACGFHGWSYGRDGVPNHIPRNAELFGLAKEQRIALALPAVRVEAIGRFVFACLAATVPPLAQYLGPHADAYRAADALLGPVISHEAAALAASWRLYAEISLDDYHLHSIHPTTFGVGEELPLYKVVYRRDGLHSAYFKRRDPDWSFDGFWRELATGALDRTGYKIFNSFPGMILDVMRDVCIASTVVAIDAERSVVESYVFTWRDAVPSAELAEATAEFYATVHREDREACARWQRSGAGPLGKLEERVGWFREALAEITGRAAAG